MDFIDRPGVRFAPHAALDLDSHLAPGAGERFDASPLAAGAAADDAREWLPLLEYSVRTGVSLSTLRRYIKAGKVEFKVEDGRYLLPLAEGMTVQPQSGVPQAPSPVATHPQSVERTPAVGSRNDPAVASLKAEIARLEMELRRAREENAELRMLVALYEDSQGPGQA